MAMKDFGILSIGAELKKNKVFVISMPKSATTSTSMFIEKYGYKTIHWIGGIIDIKNVSTPYQDFYLEFAEDYDCCSDSPFHVLYKELDVKYPNSKFIFIEREVNAWALSQLKHDKHHGYSGRLPAYSHYVIEEEYYGGGKLNYNFDTLKKIHKIHKEKVLDYFKDKDNLLILNLEDNNKEKKICNFLSLKYDQNIKFKKDNANAHAQARSIPERNPRWYL